MTAQYLNKIFTKLSVFLTVFVLAVFTLVFFLGIFDCMSRLMHPMEMSTSVVIDSADCPQLMNQKGSCSMELLEHLSIWQGTFRANFQPNILNLLIALLITSWCYVFGRILIPETAQVIKPKWYLKLHRDLKLYNYLQQLFSQGILARRVYA